MGSDKGVLGPLAQSEWGSHPSGSGQIRLCLLRPIPAFPTRNDPCQIMPDPVFNWIPLWLPIMAPRLDFSWILRVLVV